MTSVYTLMMLITVKMKTVTLSAKMTRGLNAAVMMLAISVNAETS